MRVDADFHAAYRELEGRMKAFAERDCDVFLPNREPAGPVQYVLICMEPSLGGGSADKTKSRVERGFRNFLSSMEDFILHFCARRYLCGPGQRYHVTDWSKGAMRASRAGSKRARRYERWYPLLIEELDLVASDSAGIVAVGKLVSDYLERHGFSRPFTRVIHYSGQAGRARKEAVRCRKEDFAEFRDTVSLQDVVATAHDVLTAAGVPADIYDETLSRLRRGQLTTSRQALLFTYKIAFEDMANRSSVRSIDEYIAEFPPDTQKVLEEMRAVIRERAPAATETISYAMPTFDLNGKHLVHFAGFEKHIGFYPTASGIAAFKEEIEQFKWAKGSVQFPLGQPLPTDLIRRIVDFRVDEVTRKATK